jgi:isocitrate/isopropylmalate dehydrogenase
MKTYNGVRIPGDGIEPGFTDATVVVLQTVEKREGFSLVLDAHVAGASLSNRGNAVGELPIGGRTSSRGWGRKSSRRGSSAR